jgi:hypothetical protein
MRAEVLCTCAACPLTRSQAAYQARLDRAAQGFCLNDPLSPVFILRWVGEGGGGGAAAGRGGWGGGRPPRAALQLVAVSSTRSGVRGV